MANGILLFYLVAAYSTNVTALKVIISFTPVFSALGTAILTWIGMKLYAEKMAKISVGSYIKKKGGVTPLERKGSVQKAEDISE